MNRFNPFTNAMVVDTATEATKVRHLIKRSEADEMYRTRTGDKRTCVKDLNDKEYTFSSRIGEAMALFKKAQAYMVITNGNAELSINKSVSDVADQWEISKSAVWDKVTRQFGITGLNSIDRARELYREALVSDDHRFDDLLVYMSRALTRKDDIDDVRNCYLNI